MSHFISKQHSNIILLANLARAGYIFEYKNMDLIKKTIFKNSKVLFTETPEFEDIMKTVLKLDLLEVSFDTIKNQNLLRRAFKRQILINIMKTDFFSAHSAILITKAYDSFIIKTENIKSLTTESYIQPTYSFNYDNKMLIGFSTKTKVELSQRVKEEALNELLDIIIKLESNEEIIPSQDSFYKYADYILEKY